MQDFSTPSLKMNQQTENPCAGAMPLSFHRIELLNETMKVRITEGAGCGITHVLTVILSQTDDGTPDNV